MILVDVVMRSNFAEQFGGDVLQMRRLTGYLPSHEFDVRLLAAGRDLHYRPGAIVHIVNIDRPWDFLEAVSLARRAGSRVIVTPIHHDLARVQAIKAARPLTSRRLAEVALPAGALEYLKRWRRSGVPNVSRSYAYVLSGRRLWEAVGRELRSAHKVLLLAEGEGVVLGRDCGGNHTNTLVIPNGLPATGAVASWASRDIQILVPGRVEPRKNQLRLAEALAGSGVQATFIGAANPLDGRYVTDFHSVVSSASNLRYLSPVDADEMPELYMRSKVVINASFVEVLSLVDLEAFANGCHLITTDAGHTREWLGEYPEYFDALDCDRMVQRAAVMLTRGEPPRGKAPRAHELDWMSASTILAQVYRDCWC